MLLLRLAVIVCFVQSSSVADLLKEARRAQSQGQTHRALTLADEAVTADPRYVEARMFRGLLHNSLHNYKKALADFDAVIQAHADDPEAYDQRGSTLFRLGRFQESVDDFDRFLKLRPKEKPGHWRRGISCYYAGRFGEGQKQFQAYQQVDGNDVENAVWCYLCMARTEGAEKARAGLLKIGQDPRVPMMEILALFAGRGLPREVLAAAEAGNPSTEEQKLRRFYAHLYLGLYYESLGDPAQTAEHIRLAAVEYPVAGYMGDVARVHWDLLRRKAPP